MNGPINRTHDGRSDVHLLAGAYALDALDDLDLRRFEAHLPDCESCQAEIDSYAVAVDHLGEQAVEPAPASLKASVMAEVDQTRQDSPGGTSRTLSARRMAPLVAAAAVVAALIVGGLFVRTDNRADRLEEIASIYQADDATTRSLVSERGVIEVVFSDSIGRAALSSDDLVAPESGDVYQLWIVSENVALPETTFTVDDASRTLVFSFDNSLRDGDVFGVNIEPEGGSIQPTNAPFAISDPVSR